MPGLQTNIPLLFLAVLENKISLERAIELVSTNPQKIFRIQVPAETYTLLELKKFEIKNQDIQSKCGWTPYHGMQAYGKVHEVWIRGKKVFDGQQVLVNQGFGNEIIINA